MFEYIWADSFCYDLPAESVLIESSMGEIQVLLSSPSSSSSSSCYAAKEVSIFLVMCWSFLQNLIEADQISLLSFKSVWLNVGKIVHFNKGRD